jgi:hypothetical protein
MHHKSATSDKSTHKLQNTIVTAVKLTSEGHERHRHPKEPVMMLGACAEKPAKSLEEEEDLVDENQHLRPKDIDESGKAEPSNSVEGLQHNKHDRDPRGLEEKNLKAA